MLRKRPSSPLCRCVRPRAGWLPAALLAAGALPLLGGCAVNSSSTDAMGDTAASPASSAAASNGRDTTEDPFSDLGYRRVWKGYAVVEDGSSLEFLHAFDDILIAQTSTNLVTALDADSASIRWREDIASDLDLFLGHFRLGDQLLAVSETELLKHDIRTGEFIESIRLTELASSEPVISGNVMAYGTSRGNIVGQSVDTGFKQWWIPMNDTIDARPAIVGEGDIAAVSDRGGFVIIDSASGRVFGRQQTIHDGIDNRPVGDEEAVYIASRDQSVWAFDVVSGEQLWRDRTPRPITAQPALIDDTLYVPREDTGLTAYNKRTGEIRWKAGDVDGEVIGIVNDRLFVWNGSVASLVDPESGDVINSRMLPPADTLLLDSFEDGNLYLAWDDGSIEKYVPRF